MNIEQATTRVKDIFEREGIRAAYHEAATVSMKVIAEENGWLLRDVEDSVDSKEPMTFERFSFIVKKVLEGLI